jgi:glycosyltransferase involved in cell wall biosynthesis
VEDLGALEKAMREMTEENGVAEHYARKAKERVKQCYSIREVASRYVQLYESLIVRRDGYLS